ncbi:MAG: LacI family DNA-binding transcriptional regulator [Chloroflexota bacterium]
MSRATLKDVAARAGVSYQTVSKVLHGQAQVAPETATRIWQVVHEINYEPNLSARRLRAGATHLLGYAWHHTPSNLVHPVLDAFLHSAAMAAAEQDYHLFTFATHDDKAGDVGAYEELYGRHQVDGFILADTNRGDPRIRFLIEHEIPFATFGRANDDWDFCWVDVDGQQGMERVMAHLVARGHRRIAMISWPEGSQSGWYREQGYWNGLQRAGIAAEAGTIERAENLAPAGAAAMARLLDLPAAQRPTAVVCVSDLVAIGALKAVANAGLEVGRDIAITGFDDIPLVEYLRPPLTSVRQPTLKAGQWVVKMLIQQIEGEPIAHKGILLEPELVVRQSS